jgi:uncharacterized membrane protein
MKILHLITDHQVIERTLGIYEEVFPGCNDVLVFSEKGMPFKRLKGDYKGKIVNYRNLRQTANKYDFSQVTHVISHFMSFDKIDFIKLIPKNIPVCWEIYGYDLYNQFLEPRGYEIYYTNPLKYYKYSWIRIHFGFFFNILANVKGYKFYNKYTKNKQFKYISKRINSIQFCCGYDAEYVKKIANRDIHSYEIFNYSLNTVLGDLRGGDFSIGEDVLVGNSASFSNNHLYVLNFLKQIKIPRNTKLIMPLSYGGTSNYADDVESVYRENYPEQIEVLRNYIPLNEYNKYFLRLKAMILSAWRQESQGTAMMGFYLGVKVFMSEKSPLYKWFVDCGFIVFVLERITSEELATPLTLEEKSRNRAIVEERYNEKRINEILKMNIQ